MDARSDRHCDWEPVGDPEVAIRFRQLVTLLVLWSIITA
jgi:hypothetical protein